MKLVKRRGRCDPSAQTEKERPFAGAFHGLSVPLLYVINSLCGIDLTEPLTSRQDMPAAKVEGYR